MQRISLFFATLLLLLAGMGSASAGGVAVSVAPAATNPAPLRMGDRIQFHSAIENHGTTPVEGLIAWISLVQIDKGKEQPMDLEDWSAHKAVTVPSLAPGAAVQTDWPMRLIQSGRYRVVISVVGRNLNGLTASPFVDFQVQPKPVVESGRVLPVAFGVPLVILALLLWRRRA